MRKSFSELTQLFGQQNSTNNFAKVRGDLTEIYFDCTSIINFVLVISLFVIKEIQQLLILDFVCF